MKRWEHDLANRLHRFPALYRLLRRARFGAGAVLPPLRVEGVPGRVHRNDVFLRHDLEHGVAYYVAAGQQAATACNKAFVSGNSGRSTPRTVLDFGCGFGRCLRFMAARWPTARLAVCDLDRRGPEFCAREFGAEIVASDWTAPPPLSPYDVIWLGSVFTHVEREMFESLLERLVAVLAPDGAIVFTTHGGATFAPQWELTEERSALEASIAATGFAYVPYRHERGEDYGLAWHAEEYVRARATALGLSEVLYAPRGWVEFQDVWGFTAPKQSAG